MRDIDDEFDSSDVVRYVFLAVKRDDSTDHRKRFDDSELDALIAMLAAEAEAT